MCFATGIYEVTLTRLVRLFGLFSLLFFFRVRAPPDLLGKKVGEQEYRRVAGAVDFHLSRLAYWKHHGGMHEEREFGSRTASRCVIAASFLGPDRSVPSVEKVTREAESTLDKSGHLYRLRSCPADRRHSLDDASLH